MATNYLPVAQLDMAIDRTPAEIVVHCAGKITSDTIQQLRATVKTLFLESKPVLLDLTNVTHMDSAGLGAIVGLHCSARAVEGRLKLINLNEHLKESFSITKLGQLLADESYHP
jgi:anti-anti-sigma factor